MSTRDEVLAALTDHPEGLTSKELAPKCPACDCDPQVVGRVIAGLRAEGVIHPGSELRDGGTIWIFGKPPPVEPAVERVTLPEHGGRSTTAISEAARAIAAMRQGSTGAPRPKSAAPQSATSAAPQEGAPMTIRAKIEALLRMHGPMDSRTMRKHGLKEDTLSTHLGNLAKSGDLVRHEGDGPRSTIYGLPGQKIGEKSAPPPCDRSEVGARAEGQERKEGQGPQGPTEGGRPRQAQARQAPAAGAGRPAGQRRARVRDRRGRRARNRARGREDAPGSAGVRAPARLHRPDEAGMGRRGVKRRFWTTVEDQELRELYPHVKTEKLLPLFRRSMSSILGRAATLGLSKTPEYLASPDACRLRREGGAGVAYRYPKGHVPANKGLRRPGWAPGRMAATQFKKGARSGMAAAHHMPIGAIRLMEGYVLLKVADVQNVPYTVNWKLLHVLNWERANGRPLPADHCLWFKDRNRQNPDASNLELITRAENMRRNTLHRLPKPLRRVIYAKGALNRRINRMVKERAEQHA